MSTDAVYEKLIEYISNTLGAKKMYGTEQNSFIFFPANCNNVSIVFKKMWTKYELRLVVNNDEKLNEDVKIISCNSGYLHDGHSYGGVVFSLPVHDNFQSINETGNNTPFLKELIDISINTFPSILRIIGTLNEFYHGVYFEIGSYATTSKPSTTKVAYKIKIKSHKHGIFHVMDSYSQIRINNKNQANGQIQIVKLLIETDEDGDKDDVEDSTNSKVIPLTEFEVEFKKFLAKGKINSNFPDDMEHCVDKIIKLYDNNKSC